MNFYQVRICVLILILLATAEIKCQTSPDEKLLEVIQTELKTDSVQYNSLTLLFKNYATQLDSLNTAIKTTQQSSLAEDSISAKCSVLFAERKDLRTWKENQIKFILTPEQAADYETKVKAKSRPVLHFGHNKADCNACNTSDSGLPFAPGSLNMK